MPIGLMCSSDCSGWFSVKFNEGRQQEKVLSFTLLLLTHCFRQIGLDSLWKLLGDRIVLPCSLCKCNSNKVTYCAE